MGKNGRWLFTIIFVILYIIPLNAPSSADPPSPGLYFDEIEDSEGNTRWSGSLMGGSIKSEDARITIYDDHLNIKETGLFSEYSENIIERYYVNYTDINQNGKVDAGDLLIIYQRGEVQPDWGVVITFESTGDEVCSSTLSNERFSLEEKKEEDLTFRIILLIIVLSIFTIIIIYAVKYKPRK